jgi:hypothetical protein
MKFNKQVCAFIFAIAFSASSVIAQNEIGTRAGGVHGIFQSLKVGQKVSLKESFGQWEIGLLNNGEYGSHSILEINNSYLLLIDIGQITRYWVPISSVKIVTWTKVPGVLSTKP